MLEIEQYYEIDKLVDLDIWKWEYNIPPREMAPAILEAHGKRRLTAGLWSLMGPWADSLEQANKASTFNAKAETLVSAMVKIRSPLEILKSTMVRAQGPVILATKTTRSNLRNAYGIHLEFQHGLLCESLASSQPQATASSVACSNGSDLQLCCDLQSRLRQLRLFTCVCSIDGAP